MKYILILFALAIVSCSDDGCLTCHYIVEDNEMDAMSACAGYSNEYPFWFHEVSVERLSECDVNPIDHPVGILSTTYVCTDSLNSDIVVTVKAHLQCR